MTTVSTATSSSTVSTIPATSTTSCLPSVTVAMRTYPVLPWRHSMKIRNMLLTLHGTILAQGRLPLAHSRIRISHSLDMAAAWMHYTRHTDFTTKCVGGSGSVSGSLSGVFKSLQQRQVHAVVCWWHNTLTAVVRDNSSEDTEYVVVEIGVPDLQMATPESWHQLSTGYRTTLALKDDEAVVYMLSEDMWLSVEDTVVTGLAAAWP